MDASLAREGRRPGRPMKNFHVPLPVEVYEALRHEASLLRRPATALAREGIEMWLQQRRRAVVREAIAAYAVQHAGTPVDLDPVVERASAEFLLPRKRRR